MTAPPLRAAPFISFPAICWGSSGAAHVAIVAAPPPELISPCLRTESATLYRRAHRPRKVDAGRPCSSSPRPSRGGRCASSSSTRWISSANAGSPSRQAVRVAWKGHQLNLIDTRPRRLHVRGSRPLRHARARSCSWTRLRASRRRRSQTPSSRSRTTSKSSPSSTRSTCRGQPDRGGYRLVRACRRSTRRGAAHLGQDRRGSRVRAGRHRRAYRPPSGDPRSAGARPHSTRPTTSTAVVAFVRVVDGSFGSASACARWRSAPSSRRRSSASSHPR